MTKQEIIEDIRNYILIGCEAIGCDDCGYSQIKNASECQASYIAENLYLAGYRKVNADGNAYKSPYLYDVSVLKKSARKETAKEILQELYDEAERMNNKTVELSAHYIKNTLAKEYGVKL